MGRRKAHGPSVFNGGERVLGTEPKIFLLTKETGNVIFTYR
jgi:hypothetical protein